MRCVYPCKLIKENSGYSVIFPDIPGATQGENLFDALYMAEDFLTFAIASMIKDGDEIPQPTPLDKIKLAQGEIATLIKTKEE